MMLATLVVTVLTLVGPAFGWQVPVPDANCPAFKAGVKWRDYISGTITPPGPAHSGNPFGVEFTKAKQVNDPIAIGNLATNFCYQGEFVIKQRVDMPKGYYSWRIDGSVPPNLSLKKGLPGDPGKYKLNVFGVPLRYNDQGVIFNHREQEVGILTCTNSDDRCRNY